MFVAALRFFRPRNPTQKRKKRQYVTETKARQPFFPLPQQIFGVADGISLWKEHSEVLIG